MKHAELSLCPEYQRLWRNKFVDKNLKDEWLEQLNNLKTLKLISILRDILNTFVTIVQE